MTKSLLSLLLLSLLFPLTAVAGDKPSAAVVPLTAGGAVPAPVLKRFDAKLRDAVKAHAAVAEVGAAEKAAGGRCGDAACLKKVAQGAKVRFVVSGQVSNADDIYKVQLTFFDAATETLKDTSQDCELCAAEEVDKSIVTAVDAFKAEFAKPLPPPVEVPKTFELAISSDPPGAKVLFDDKEIGKTPLKTQALKGKHKIGVAKDGFLLETHDVEVVDRAVSQDFLLQLVAPNVPVPVPVPASAPVSAAPTPVAPAVASECPPATPAATGAAPAHKTAGTILTVVGAIAAGVGGYLIALDGEPTCTDGRGIKACPNLYTTAVPGMVLMGAGAAAVGAGVTLLVLPAFDHGGQAADTRRPFTGLAFGTAF